MAIIVKKDPMKAAASLDVDDLSKEDKMDLLKHEYNLAVTNAVDYEARKKEMREYLVFLPEGVKHGDLSKVNKLYAIAQSFMSRTTAIEMDALDNQARWAKLVDLLEGYIEDRRSELLMGTDMEDLTNMKADAKVKNIMAKKYKLLRKIKLRRAEADGFVKMVQAKKKDLLSVLTTIGKQVKALSLESALLK